LKFSERQVIEFLFNIINSPLSKDENILSKTLECLSAWTQLTIIEVLDYPNLIEILIKNMENAKIAPLALDVIENLFLLTF